MEMSQPVPRLAKTRGFKVGKIPPGAMARSVFPYLGKKNPRIIVKPGIGRDAAVIRYGSKVLVFSTDPITGTGTRIGAHSVIINANDIATTGAKPVWYLCTILLPPRTTEESVRHIMAEIDRAARELDVAVAGGHTEITLGLQRPIVAGFMVGESSKRILSAANGRLNDKVLLTKSAGLEGTAILASDQSRRIGKLPASLLERARAYSHHLSVVREALALAAIPGVHALHDPTEGGVLNGLWELAEASGLGIDVWADRISVTPETEQICARLGLDPLKLMASGSLVVAVQPSAANVVARKLRELNVRVSEVGILTRRFSGLNLLRDGRRMRLQAVPRDELYRLA